MLRCNPENTHWTTLGLFGHTLPQVSPEMPGRNHVGSAWHTIPRVGAEKLACHKLWNLFSAEKQARDATQQSYGENLPLEMHRLHLEVLENRKNVCWICFHIDSAIKFRSIKTSVVTDGWAEGEAATSISAAEDEDIDAAATQCTQEESSTKLK